VNILFRANSSAMIGLGHVMRCLVLAKRLREYKCSMQISFACELLEGNINHKICEAGFDVYPLASNDVSEVLKLTDLFLTDLLVIDSYAFSLEDERKLLAKSFKTLIFDDLYQKHVLDMVLNHGIQAKGCDYKYLVPKTSKVFCGSRYTLLRDEFFSETKVETKSHHVAVIMGGNDTLNLSALIAELLRKINENFSITVLTTSANPHIASLKNNDKINLLVDAKNIAEILSHQEFIICASGGTLFEVMALKKKFINIQVADNQKSIVDFLKQNNCLTSLSANELNEQSLLGKITYVRSADIYEHFNLEFSKTGLVAELVEQLYITQV